MPGCKFTVGIVFGVTCIGLVQFAAPARAHVIDGQWCSAGRTMTIKGSTITTPGGNKIKGNYAYHFFDYIVPPGEPGAGSKVIAKLRDYEEKVDVTSDSNPKPVTWTRCQITS